MKGAGYPVGDAMGIVFRVATEVGAPATNLCSFGVREPRPTKLDLLHRRQLLLQREHGRKNISVFLGASQHFI